MKNNLFKLLCFICFIAAGWTACKKEDNAGIAGTILQSIEDDAELSLLKAAIKRVHLDTIFQDGGPYTFFAPVDSAFENAGWSADRIQKADPDSLRDLLTYHIVLGKVSSTDLIGFLKQRFISLNPGNKPFIIKNYYGIFFNGIPMVEANIKLGDGVLHKIGRLSNLPAGNLYETVLKDSELQLYAAILRRNIITPQLITYTDLLQFPPDSVYMWYTKGANFTLLAPSDKAMRSAGFTEDVIQHTEPDSLAALLNNGILANAFFTSDFLGGFRINAPPIANATAEGYTCYPVLSYLGVGYGDAVYGIDKDSRSVYFFDFSVLYSGIDNIPPPAYRGSVIRPDIIATNGVIHVMDSVLRVPGLRY